MPRAKKVASGQAYGQRKEQEEVLSTIPATNPSAPPPAQPSAMDAAQGFQMPGLTPLGAPSTRTGEPVTAGLPTGAGPGPEALGMFQSTNPGLDELRAAYMKYPVEALREYIEELEANT